MKIFELSTLKFKAVTYSNGLLSLVTAYGNSQVLN